MIRVPRRRPNLSLHGSRMLYLLSAGRQMPFTREAFVFMPSGFVADIGATHTRNPRKPPQVELHNARRYMSRRGLLPWRAERPADAAAPSIAAASDGDL